MIGEWQGEPVVAEARAYRGTGVAFARIATVEAAALSIGNLLVIPDATSSAPLFGADLVWVGTRPQMAMIACDLSPTLDDCGARAAQNGATAAAIAAAIAAASPSAATVPSGGALPAWCEAVFSPSSLYTRFGAKDADGVGEAFDGYLEAFLALARRSAGHAGSRKRMAPIGNSRGIFNYCLRHREEDRGLLLLERLFGKMRARRYLDHVLFPISIDGCAT